MTASTIVNYKNLYFQVPDLTRIHGEPTYPQLQLLLDQIKTNASSVPVQSDLGGGIHDHLGLGFSPEDYEEVSPGKPYDRPLMPAPLRIPSNTTIHETQRLQAEFKETRHFYRETGGGVEKALAKQILAAIEKKYLQAIENTITESITKHVPEVIQYLFDNYSQLSAQN